jgi:hypothetical protein
VVVGVAPTPKKFIGATFRVTPRLGVIPSGTLVLGAGEQQQLNKSDIPNSFSLFDSLFGRYADACFLLRKTPKDRFNKKIKMFFLFSYRERR